MSEKSVARELACSLQSQMHKAVLKGCNARASLTSCCASTTVVKLKREVLHRGNHCAKHARTHASVSFCCTALWRSLSTIAFNCPGHQFNCQLQGVRHVPGSISKPYTNAPLSVQYCRHERGFSLSAIVCKAVSLARGFLCVLLCGLEHATKRVSVARLLTLVHLRRRCA